MLAEAKGKLVLSLILSTALDAGNCDACGRTVLAVKNNNSTLLVRRPTLMVTVALLLLSPCFAGVEIVEIGNVQFCKTLDGVVVDPTDSPLANVQVIEVTPDWQTTNRMTRTDAEGRWSLPPVPNQDVYFLRFITKQCCFNEVRCRAKLNKRQGKALRIKLPLST
jgi:hypothetical protein